MEENKGFTVKDKRIFDEQGNPIASEKTENKTAPPGEHKRIIENKESEDAQTAEKAGGKKPPAAPEVNFSSFILSLSTSVLYHFGEVPDPITSKKQRNLGLAKQTIDILGILKDKTAGNLTREEEALLTNLLYDLRMRYVKEVEKGAPE